MRKGYLWTGLLNLLQPGTGYIYLGKTFLGMGLVVFHFLLMTLILEGTLIYGAKEFYFFIMLLFISYGVALIDCWRRVRKGELKDQVPLKKWGVILSVIALIHVSSHFLPHNLKNFSIPGSSMEPTLRKGDYVVAHRTDLIGRGDVVVFQYPKDPRITYAKRVVGVPGDTVEVKNKILFVNGQAIQTELVAINDWDKWVSSHFISHKLSMLKASLGNKSHFLIHDNESYYSEDFPALSIPAQQYFVMGDNRDYSSDSRLWGTVHQKEIFGKVKFVYFTSGIGAPFSRIHQTF